MTDRQDLDGQIYRNFQKFRYDKGKAYPRLFDPKDGREVIVMVDEAHRTQYQNLAENMRAGLKGAHFLAFTGTPLFYEIREDFGAAQYKNIEIADMRAFIEAKLHSMMAQNGTRVAFAARLQAIIERYNAGSSSTDNYFADLVRFTQAMQAEDERHVREGLSEDALELYDLLKKDKLSQAEEQRVKLAAKDLLIRLLQEHPQVLVQDWWKDSQTQLAVKNAIEAVLDKDLPDSYDRVTFKTKCDNVFALVLDFAANRRKWAA